MINIESIIRSDAICSMIFVILAGLLYAETRFRTRADRWIAVAILTGLLSVLVSIASWALDTVALVTPVQQMVGTWVQFGSYMVSPFMILAFLAYTWVQVGARGSRHRRWVSVPFLVVVLVESILAYATVTGSTVVYDAAGHVAIRSIDVTAYVLDLLLMFYSLGFTIAHRRELGGRVAASLGGVYAMGIAGVVVEASGPCFYDIGFVGMALCQILAVIFIPIQRSLRAKESEAAKAMFVAAVSHDIRTPLNAILGYAALLREKAVPESEREQALEAIASSGNLLMGLVNDVLDFSKIEQGMMTIAPEPTDVEALAEEVMMVFRGSTAGSRVRLVYTHDIQTRLEVDGRRLRQILFNLIGNAVKFTTEGEIALRVSFLPAQNGLGVGTLIMSVSDTGIGIPADRQGDLMQPYVQLQPRGPNGGTGLGLYICRRLVEAMGGTLTLVSEYGRGSTFTLTIHGVREVSTRTPNGETSEATPPADASRRRMARVPRILLVDDAEINLKVTQSLLRRIGCTDVVLAHSGAEALATLRADPSITCVLTDMWMPEMDGNALAVAIRGDPAMAHLPVYAVTGNAGMVLTDGAFDGVLLKPITSDGLKTIFWKES